MSNYTGAAPDTTSRNSWQQHAACRADGVDPDWFYPDNNINGIELARSICTTCPVRRACLTDCLRHEGGRSSLSRWGIYAGLTPRQRARLYQKLRDAGGKP